MISTRLSQAAEIDDDDHQSLYLFSLTKSLKKKLHVIKQQFWPFDLKNK